MHCYAVVVVMLLFWHCGCCQSVVGGCQGIALQLSQCSLWLLWCYCGIVIVARVLKCSSYSVVDSCQGVAMQLPECSGWLLCVFYAAAMMFEGVAIVLTCHF